MLKHQEQIDAFYAWRIIQANRKREYQLEIDEKCVEFAEVDYENDTYSELTIKE